MAKRGPTSQIHHDNWDEPFEAEEAGTFSSAPQEILQKRTIKTAKRRIRSSENCEGAKPAFASFSGFKTTASTLNPTVNSKSFGFLGNVTSTSSSKPTTNGTMSTTNGTKLIAPPSSTEVTPQEQYLTDLQQLNRSVSDWIKTHVDSNPVCILTPVFTDYEKYLKQIQDKRDACEKSGSTVSSAPGSLASFSFVSSSTGDNNKFKIDVPTTLAESNKTNLSDSEVNTSVFKSVNPAPSIFSLPKASGKSPLLQESDSKNPTPSLFSTFKSESTASSLLKKPDPSSLMVNPFTSVLKKEETPEAKPLTFSNGSATTSSSIKKDEEGEEESEEPPKVEFTPIQEEGSVFSTRCKVFVKKDTNYKDRGVGTLFIKKVGEEKHQLLVRAETVLGNVLVNVLLTSGIPTQRMGKNNVMLVCLPTPQDPPPPTTVLLRVKTAEEADDLLKTLEQYKT